MADEIENLNTITSHPSYARAISLEISKNNEDSFSSSIQRRRPPKKSRDIAFFEELDDLLDTDLSDFSDFSEYYSAEEDFEHLKIESGADENDDDSQTFAEEGVMEQGSSLKVGRSRAPSKKQKRRRRELRNKILGDFDIPFQDVENMDFELEEMMEDVISCDKAIQKELPSLFELCLNQVRSRNLDSAGSLPGPIKTIISKWKQKRLFLQIQNTWLHRILSAHEEESILQTYSAIKDNNDYETDTGKYVFAYKVRNVWTLQEKSYGPNQYGDKHGSSWLNHTINKIETSEYDDRWNQSTVYMFNLLAVVCNMIELLLQQLDDRKIKETDLNKKIERKLQIVRFILAKKYPNIVNCLYDDAIPYIYWAHGNNLTGAHFLQLAHQADEKDNRRAVLLAEAARFYTHLNDTNLASKLHRQAADIMMSRTTPHNPLLAEIKGQMLILLANLFDQGPMVPIKSRKSLESWKHVLQAVSTKVPRKTWLEAVESCLCYHCGVWQEGDTNQLEECLKLVDSIVQQGYESLFLHKSFIEAFLGLHIPSLTSYQQFRFGFPHITGKKDLNPWKPILNSCHTMKLLPVMWRTQMQFIHIPSDMNCVNEFDVQGRHLNFGMSNHGHLTGDFQMLLPPLKTVELDLYTGQQVFYPNSCLTNTWHFDDFDPVRCNNYYYNPTLTEIYNFEGNTVHILMVSTLAGVDVVYHQEGLNNVYWTGPNGDKARLNLVKFTRDCWKKVVLRQIEAEREKNPRAGKGNKGSVTWVEEMKEALENLFKQGAEFDMYKVETRKKNMKKLKKEKEKKGGRTKVEKTTKFPNKIVKYLRYGTTLFLLVKTTIDNTIAIFIDCSSKESFLKPVTHLNYCGYFNDNLVHNYLPPTVNQVVPRTDTIWWFCQSDKNNSAIMAVKQGGKCVHTKTTTYILDKQCLPLVLNNRFFRVNSFTKKITVQSFDGEDEDIYSDEEEHHFDGLQDTFVVGNLLLIKLEDKLIFVDPITFEKQSIQVLGSTCSLPVKNGDNEISKHYEAIDVIHDNNNNDTGIIEIVLAIDYHFLLLQIDESSKGNINIVLCIEVPGHAIEFKHISQQAGFLVSVTQHHKIAQEYKEHIFQYKYNGELVGVLPFLGPGPRDMFTMYLKGDDKINKKYESRLACEGWYAYLRDGHGAIMSLYLGKW